jgi:hypothetical protein
MRESSLEICEQSVDLRFANFVSMVEVIQSRFSDKRDAFVGWDRGREFEGSACARSYESNFKRRPESARILIGLGEHITYLQDNSRLSGLIPFTGSSEVYRGTISFILPPRTRDLMLVGRRVAPRCTVGGGRCGTAG